MEHNQRTCKICNILTYRILNGKFNYKDKNWIDETGRSWNGNVCPKCNKIRVKKSMNALRSKQKNVTI
jgi:hypothetical protein